MEIYGIQVLAETVPADDDGEETLLDLLANEVVALHATIAQLREEGETTIAEREEWKARALAAESGIDGKFLSLRRLLAHELHPDHSQDESERIMRAEIFKRLWPEIERIADA